MCICIHVYMSMCICILYVRITQVSICMYLYSCTCVCVCLCVTIIVVFITPIQCNFCSLYPLPFFLLPVPPTQLSVCAPRAIEKVKSKRSTTPFYWHHSELSIVTLNGPAGICTYYCNRTCYVPS